MRGTNTGANADTHAATNVRSFRFTNGCAIGLADGEPNCAADSESKRGADSESDEGAVIRTNRQPKRAHYFTDGCTLFLTALESTDLLSDTGDCERRFLHEQLQARLRERRAA